MMTGYTCMHCGGGHLGTLCPQRVPREQRDAKAEIERIVDSLRALTDEQREEVLKHFCRSCHDYIKQSDWQGLNYCVLCSPDMDSSPDMGDSKDE